MFFVIVYNRFFLQNTQYLSIPWHQLLLILKYKQNIFGKIFLTLLEKRKVFFIINTLYTKAKLLNIAIRFKVYQFLMNYINVWENHQSTLRVYTIFIRHSENTNFIELLHFGALIPVYINQYLAESFKVIRVITYVELTVGYNFCKVLYALSPPSLYKLSIKQPITAICFL